MVIINHLNMYWFENKIVRGESVFFCFKNVNIIFTLDCLINFKESNPLNKIFYSICTRDRIIF